MVIVYDSEESEEAWLKACNGNRGALVDAFVWDSTEEGYEFWRRECYLIGPMQPKLMERIRYLYVEWKLLGDTYNGEDGDG